jgi:hypothetical protein
VLLRSAGLQACHIPCYDGRHMPIGVRLPLTLALVILGATALPLRGQGQAPPAPPPSSAVDPLYRVADEVSADVEKLRGWKFKRPVRKDRTTLADARRYLESRIDQTLPPSRRAVTEAFLRTAGLVPPACDLRASLANVLEQQVAGYYDPASGTLHLVERSDGMPGFMQRTVLAHELTHALDDQYVGLGELNASPASSRTEDEDVVRGSLAEGSATALMFQYLVQQTMAGKVNAAEAAEYFKKELARAQSLEQMPRYFNALFGSYLVGSAFLARGNLQAVLAQPDNRAVGDNFVAAWRTPPRSSEQILHPDKYWEPARSDEPVVVDDMAADRWLATPARAVVHRDTLGELLVALLTEPRGTRSPAERMTSTDGWTNVGASGWGGDRFYLLASGADEKHAAAGLQRLQGVWVTAWDSEKDREEFVTALAAGPGIPNASVQRAGARAAIVFVAFTAEEREALMERLRTSPLRFEQAGRPWKE